MAYGEFSDITLLSTRRSPITTYCDIIYIYIKERIMKILSYEYHNKCIIAYQKKNNNQIRYN